MSQLNTRYLIFFAAISVLLGGALIWVLFPRGFKEPVEPVDLTVWGVFDTSALWSSETFGRIARERTEGVKSLQYRVIPVDEYERTLLTELAAGRGPDIFYIHNSWLPKVKDFIVPQPVVSPAEQEAQKSPYLTFRGYTDTFVDVVVKDFTAEDTVFAIPLYVDTLALFYNKDIFNAAGITTPPQDWDGFVQDVQKITKVDAFGNIQLSGAAIGSADNVNRAPDILSLLMMQLGSPMVSEKENKAVFGESQGYRTSARGAYSSPGEEALVFYTNFTNPTKNFYAWNDAMPYAIDAFYSGKTAMMINYSHHIATIERKAPYLNFGVAKIPQIAGVPIADHLSLANYWGLAVSRNSQHPEQAWRLLARLTEADAQRGYVTAIGRPPARRDLVPEYRSDPKFGVFAEQSLIAASWKQPDNNEVDTLFLEMINDVASGKKTPSEAVRRAQEQVNLLFRR